MDLSELQTRVDQYVRLDLAPLYEAYLAQGGAADIEGFLAFLGSSRIVDASLLKELHGMTDVEIPSVTDAAFAGTMLQKWAATRGGATEVDPPTQASANARGGDATFVDPPRPDAGPAPEPPRAEVRFEPVTKLGQGAMGAIHIARDLYLRRKVALKSVLPEMAGHPQLLGRFLSEMQITAQLEHPNIVPVYALEVGADGSLGYAMKLVQGRDLEQLLEETRDMLEKGMPLDEEHKLEKRLEHFLKVCDALEFAHAKGIVHRDLKPANVMIGRHNEVYLMDWGIARPMGAGGQALEAGIELNQTDGSQAADLSRTRVGSAIGTPFYMSPEQAEGNNADLDGRSDVYTMGLILQECISTKRAVGGTTLQEVLTKAKEARRDPVPIGERQGDVPKEVEAIVRKATRLAPSERYQSVRELGDDVRRLLRGEAVSVLPEGPIRKATRWLSKHRTATVAIILGVALIGAAGTIGALLDGQARINAEHTRELRVSQMQTESAIQAQLVDRELGRYEAALEEFVGSARVALGHPAPPGAPLVFADGFANKDAPVPGLAPSKQYGKDVSVALPVLSVAPGVDRAPLEPLLGAASALAPEFRALLIGSSGAAWDRLSPEQQRASIADVGVPVRRASLALREGVLVSFPAMAGGAAGDPRAAPAYKLGEAGRGVVWGKPVATPSGALLPASAAVHDETGAFRGVAMIEVSLDRLLARPDAGALDYVQTKLLVGRDGKVMASASKPEEDVPLAQEVIQAIAAGKSGSLTAIVAGRTMQYAYYPLATLDWYYVSAGEMKKMLTSTAKLVTSDPRKIIEAFKPPPPPVVTAAPAAAPPPPPPPTPAVEADAGVDEPADAGVAPAPDAGVPAWKKGPLPKASSAPSAPTTPSAAPSAPPPDENPFDKWDVYKKKKKGGK